MPDNPAALSPQEGENNMDDLVQTGETKIGHIIDSNPEAAAFLDTYLPDADFENPETHEQADKLIEAFKVYKELGTAIKEAYGRLGKQGLDVELSSEELDGAIDEWLKQRAGEDPEGFASWGADWAMLDELEQAVRGREDEYAAYADYARDKRRMAASMQESAQSQGEDGSMFDYRNYLKSLQTAAEMNEEKKFGIKTKKGLLGTFMRSGEEWDAMATIQNFDDADEPMRLEDTLGYANEELDRLTAGESYLKLLQLREKFFADFAPRQQIAALMREKVDQKMDDYLGEEKRDANKAEEMVQRVRAMESHIGGMKLYDDAMINEMEMDAEGTADAVINAELTNAMDAFDQTEKGSYSKVKGKIDELLGKKEMGHMRGEGYIKGVVSLMNEMVPDLPAGKKVVLKRIIAEVKNKHRNIFS